MKSDRLLSTLLLLQSHGRMSGRELAEKLEVSERTVHRDMEALSAAGVPVYALRGAQGGWLLDADWRTVVPGLDDAELHALLMAQPRMAGDTRLAAAAEGALRKLMAAMPERQRDRAAGMRQRLYVDPTGWSEAAEERVPMLAVLQDAVARDRKLRFVYEAPGQAPGERVVDPLGLVAKGMVWYLVAQTARGFRTYRVSRVAEARVLEEQACERPAGFDLESHWRAAQAGFRASQPRHEVVLKVDAEVAPWIRRYRKAETVETRERQVTLRLEFDSLNEALFVALGLGNKAMVVSPVELAERVKETVLRMAERLSVSVPRTKVLRSTSTPRG